MKRRNVSTTTAAAASTTITTTAPQRKKQKNKSMLITYVVTCVRCSSRDDEWVAWALFHYSVHFFFRSTKSQRRRTPVRELFWTMLVYLACCFFFQANPKTIKNPQKFGAVQLKQSRKKKFESRWLILKNNILFVFKDQKVCSKKKKSFHLA